MEEPSNFNAGDVNCHAVSSSGNNLIISGVLLASNDDLKNNSQTHFTENLAIADNINIEVGSVSETEYTARQNRKREARQKKKDKEKEAYDFTVDLQAVLLPPKSKVSTLHYRTFASIWVYFLKESVIPSALHDGAKIILYTDGCSYQTCNAVMANALLNLAATKNIAIEQKYLESGHTQMEANSMHSTIEKHVRDKVINMSAKYVTVRWLEKIRNHIMQILVNLICIITDIVGCFNLPHKNSPLQKTPESPELLKTKFYLYTRSTDFNEPEVLYYDDNDQSLNGSSFRISGPLKVVVHGYMSKWNEKAAMIITNSYLKMYDCNVILMDWHMGARGPHYPVAAANTELVGRQLGILLTNMVKKGLDPRSIHLIGFSLGAHVSGTASESLKDKGYLLGRITGLDPASPLFRNNYLRENYKKLDRSDAKFVDVIHTDSSPFVTDGFGIWDPIGHVDFFPNGGQDQPGCNDVRDSIVVSHFGTQLQAIIELSDKNGPLKGILKLQLTSKNISWDFHTNFEFKITEITGKTIYALGAANYTSIANNIDSLEAKFSYVDLASEEKRFDRSYIPVIYFNKLLLAVLQARYKNWKF
ncbi:unnamed protein product [Diabrotica balteata]|uniref:Lipase domain-containing protein n=1 Tax=Diabrotica balteata TaxID=107213 RepID=A0A9N9SU90_DIABA|nr:unnamed protein product [Diabrotica balteata]